MRLLQLLVESFFLNLAVWRIQPCKLTKSTRLMFESTLIWKVEHKGKQNEKNIFHEIIVYYNKLFAGHVLLKRLK